MPLSRYQIRNEFSLADPELYRAADKDDPEALLEGVAMAGLVGVLRQLGDLAEFAAEIFHDLHEEVMATAARGHSLTIRVQQLEAELPSIEKAFLSQTSHSSFFYNSGTEWHPNLRMDQNMVTQGDLPRFVMDSYEECRGPPRLFLLDKFDVAGAGACLKRYTDPSFFKEGASSFEMANNDFQREKRTRKAKQKKGSRWRNGETPEVLPTTHAKLHQLFMEEERIENGTNNSARRVKLKRRLNGFPFDTKTGKSYMEKFLRTLSPEHKVVHEVSVDSSPLKLPANGSYETRFNYAGNNAVSADEEATQTKISLSPTLSPSQSEENDAIKQPTGALNEAVSDDEVAAISTYSHSSEVGDVLPTSHKVATENEISIDGEERREYSMIGYHSDDIVSEVENYVDALGSMDSELDTDSELRARTNLHFLNREKQLSTNHDQIQSQSSDSQSIGNSTLSDDANSTSKKEVSSFSSSGSPSTSAETAPLEGDAASMAEIREIQMCYSPVDLRPIDEGVASALPSQQVVFSEASSGAAEHHRQSYGLKPLGTSSLLDSALIPEISEAGTVMGEDALLKPAISEMLSILDKDGSDSTSVPETSANQHMDASASINFDARNQTGGDLPPVVSADNQLHDELHTADVTGGKNITSANHSDVPRNSGDDLPATLSADDHNGDNSATDDLSNNSSNPFTPQKRDELLSFENIFLDKLGRGVLNSVDNTNCSDNLPSHPTSSKYGYSPSSAINCSTDESNDEDRNISSGASAHLPNVLEASSEEECVKHDLLIASKEEIGEDNCIKIFEDQIGSSNLSVVKTENEPLDSTSKAETVNSSVKLDEPILVSEEENAEDDCTTNSDGHIGPSNLSVIQSMPEISGMTHSIPPFDTREVANSNSWQARLDEALSTTNDAHMVPGPDLIERDTSSLSPCLESTSEEPAVLHARVTEPDKLNAESAAASLASQDEYSGGMSAASLDIKELQDDGLQSESLLLQGDPKDSGALNEIGHHIDTVTSDLHEIAGYNYLQSEVLTSSIDKTSSMQLHFERSSFSEEQKSSPRSSSRDVMGGALPLQDHPCAEQEAELPRDQLDNEIPLDNGEPNLRLLPPLEQELSCESDQAGASSKFMLANNPVQAPPEDECEDFPSSLRSQCAEEKTEVACNQLDKEELLVGDENNSLPLPRLEKEELVSEAEDISELSSKLEEIQESGHVHQEGSFDASSRTMPKNFPFTPSAPKLLPHGNSSVNISEQYKNPFTCISPGVGLYPGADQINLEEMPPLPPLPPVQWRMGKFQRTAPVQEREVAQNETSSLFSLPPKPDQTVLHSEQSLPLPAVTNESSSLVYEYGAGHSGSFPSQVPQTVPDENSKESLNVLTSMQPLNSISQVVPVDDASTTAFGTSSEEIVPPVKQVTENISSKRQELQKDFTNSEGNLATNNRLGPFVSLEDSGSLGASQSSDREMIKPQHHVALEPSMKEAKIDKDSTSLEENLVKGKELIQSEHQVEPETSLKELKLGKGSSSSEVNLVTHDTVPSDKKLTQPEYHMAPETSVNEPKLDKASTILEENLFRRDNIPVDNELSQPKHHIAPKLNSKELECEKGSAHLEENLVRDDTVQSEVEMDFQKPQEAKTSLEEGDNIWPAVEEGTMFGSRKMKLPRPRSPLIEAVAAHDKSKLRKVTDRVEPPEQKVDKRDMLLEQIRNQTFNLKPTVMTRPNIQAPQTNLRVAAILEKAKTIRQALTGSDEEDDDDSWD